MCFLQFICLSWVDLSVKLQRMKEKFFLYTYACHPHRLCEGPSSTSSGYSWHWPGLSFQEEREGRLPFPDVLAAWESRPWGVHRWDTLIFTCLRDRKWAQLGQSEEVLTPTRHLWGDAHIKKTSAQGWVFQQTLGRLHIYSWRDHMVRSALNPGQCLSSPTSFRDNVLQTVEFRGKAVWSSGGKQCEGEHISSYPPCWLITGKFFYKQPQSLSSFPKLEPLQIYFFKASKISYTSLKMKISSLSSVLTQGFWCCQAIPSHAWCLGITVVQNLWGPGEQGIPARLRIIKG